MDIDEQVECLENYISQLAGDSWAVPGNSEAISFMDLGRIMADTAQYFDDALERKAIYPHQQKIVHMLNYMDMAGSIIYECGAGNINKEYLDGPVMELPVPDAHGRMYAFTLHKDDIEGALSLFESTAARLNKTGLSLLIAEAAAEKRIGLEILPGIDGERACFGQAKIIVPTREYRSICCHIFDISVETKGDEQHIWIDQLTDRGYNSVEDAMGHEGMEDALTVGIAKNTEGYPLAETSLYILQRKYMALLLPGHNKGSAFLFSD